MPKNSRLAECCTSPSKWFIFSSGTSIRAARQVFRFLCSRRFVEVAAVTSQGGRDVPEQACLLGEHI